MKLDFKGIMLILSVVALIFFGYSWYYANKHKEEAQRLEHVRLIRNDSLRKIITEKGILYEKLVADTLSKKQLREKIKELGLELENALLAQKIVFVPRDTIKIIEDIKTTDTTLTFTDYYPKKEGYFVRHITNHNTKDTTATGEFGFNPITMSLGISEQKDGTYKVTTKMPDYFNINSIDVQSLPIEKEEKDNWGILVGADYVNDFDSENKFLDVNSYLRYKKFYIGGGFRTDNTVKAGLKFEF